MGCSGGLIHHASWQDDDRSLVSNEGIVVGLHRFIRVEENVEREVTHTTWQQNTLQ